MSNRRQFLKSTILAPSVFTSNAFAMTKTSDFQIRRTQQMLEEMVRSYVDKYHYPAIWAAVSVRGRTLGVVANGVRKVGNSELVTINDRLMIGSVSKPVTGTLLGILIDKGIVKWETKVKEVLPELAKEYDRPWLDATILQLQTHLSGCPSNPSKPMKITTQTKSELRYQFVKAILADKELCLPGEKYMYSSGHIVVVAMIERLMKKSFEKIIEEYLYLPLNIKNGGLGTPVLSTEDLSQPWGHVRFNDTKITTAKRFTDNNPSLEFHPSGGIHMSILDLINFGTWHATNRKTNLQLCSKSGFEKMYQHPFNECFATGFWNYGSSYGHNGLTGSHWTNLQIYPEQTVIAVHTNMAEGPITNDYSVNWPDLIVGPLIGDIYKGLN